MNYPEHPLLRSDLQGNGELCDDNRSLHHSRLGDEKSGAADTPPLRESHRHSSCAGTDTRVEEWKIKRPSTNIPVTTDNAKNLINAVNEAGLGPQIGCYTVNLASQKGISVNRMDHLLGRIRKVISYFHRSTTAAHVLKTKQEMLKLPTHKLIHDVPKEGDMPFYVAL